MNAAPGETHVTWETALALYQQAKEENDSYDRDVWTPASTAGALTDEIDKRMEELQEAYLLATDFLIEKAHAPNVAAVQLKLELALARSDGFVGIFDDHRDGIFADLRRLGDEKAAAVSHDSAIEDAWQRRKVAFETYNLLPETDRPDGQPYTPEEAAQWDIIDASEDTIRSAVARTPQGIATQLWVQLSHCTTTREDEEAVLRRDLAYFEAQGEMLDWTERLTIAAIRSLQAIGDPATPLSQQREA